MKRFSIYLIVFSIMAVLGCHQSLQVKSENPKSVNLKKYKVIQVGWLNYPAANWRSYGFKSQAQWIGVANNLNRKSLKQYLQDALGGKRIAGPAAKSNAIPRRGDLFIKLGFRGIKREFSQAWGGFDYLTASVEFYDIRTRRRIYSAVVTVSSARAFPHNWKAQMFEGRLDNEIYNLADFIAGKF